MDRETIYRRAAHSAAEIFSRIPKARQTIPVRASAIARSLGLTVIVEPSLAEVAQKRGSRILVRRNVPSAAGRFAVAHEIGHHVLETRLASEPDRWSLRDVELFADAFAASLLIPPGLREFARDEITVADAQAVVATAERFDVSIACLLTFIHFQTSWMQGSRRIYGILDTRPNRVTGTDPRLRLVHVCFDRSSMFIPTNRRAEKVFRDIGFLNQLGVGNAMTIDSILTIAWRRAARPRYLPAEVSASVSVMRLRSPATFVFAANLSPRPAEWTTS